MIEDTEVKHIYECKEREQGWPPNIWFDPGWYFATADEDLSGPYKTREETIKNFDDYCRNVLGS